MSFRRAWSIGIVLSVLSSKRGNGRVKIEEPVATSLTAYLDFRLKNLKPQALNPKG